MIAALRKFFVVPSVVLILAIAYALICLLVFLTKGRRWPLEKKLAIGCLLVSLNAAAPVQAWAAGSCYEQVSPVIIFNGEEDKTPPASSITVTRNVTDPIRGILRFGQSYRFDFQVVNASVVLAEGEVLPLDGKIDTSEEQVTMALDYGRLPAGTYDLLIFYSYRAGNGWQRIPKPAQVLKLKVLEQ